MKKLLWLLASLMILPFFSCTKEGDTIYVNDDTITDNRPMVYFIYRKGNMGDLTYTDAIYRGILEGTSKNNLPIALWEIPADTAVSKILLSILIEFLQGEENTNPTLIVLTNDGMEPALHYSDSLIRRDSNLDILFLESRDTTLHVHTMYFPLYGACYQAGRVVGEAMEDVDSVFVANANRYNNTLADMRDGFSDGLNDAGRKVAVSQYYLSEEDGGGYNMGDSIYFHSYLIDKTYQMVLPLCGSTIQGFLRYNREHPYSFYTVGMDADLQQYSSRVPFSLVKHLDAAVSDWIDRWAAGETMPHHLSYGMSSGYTEMVVSKTYAGKIDSTAQRLKYVSQEKEKVYESKK